MNADVEAYYRILLSKKFEFYAVEGQRVMQEAKARAARTGLTGSGVHLAGLLGLYCDWNIRQPTLAALELYDEACKALSAQPEEADYDAILRQAEETVPNRVATANQFVHNDLLRGRMVPGDWASPLQQSAAATLGELKRSIELKKLELRSRDRRKAPPFQIFISCGQVTTAEKALGKEITTLVSSLPGYRGYLAQNQNSPSGVTEHILKALNDSVALICVMHHRGEVTDQKGKKTQRGSVWIEQEIAIAAFMEQVLQRRIAVRLYCENGIAVEGLRRQIMVHAVSFETPEDILTDLRDWLPTLPGLASPGGPA